MGKYTSHNLGVINRALGIGDGRPVMTDAIYDGLAIVANKIMREIDAGDYPEQTGNARQATAVAIYVDGVMSVFRSSKDLSINRPQEWDGELYWGKKQLDIALKFGAGKFGKGIWIVLFASQPYAAWLNEDHTAHIGYFDQYAEEMESLVKQIVASRANAILKGNFKPKSAGKTGNNNNDSRSTLQF